jgi:hypothetical protein
MFQLLITIKLLPIIINQLLFLIPKNKYFPKNLTFSFIGINIVEHFTNL